jgi:hypothetical protein
MDHGALQNVLDLSLSSTATLDEMYFSALANQSKPILGAEKTITISGNHFSRDGTSETPDQELGDDTTTLYDLGNADRNVDGVGLHSDPAGVIYTEVEVGGIPRNAKMDF